MPPFFLVKLLGLWLWPDFGTDAAVTAGLVELLGFLRQKLPFIDTGAHFALEAGAFDKVGFFTHDAIAGFFTQDAIAMSPA